MTTAVPWMGAVSGVGGLLNSAEFIALFADKGSGEVDLTLSKGTGSATFTRATTATTVNSSGTIISVASGVPRSYYDPTTLAYGGYLSEGARTNLVLNSLIDGTNFSTQSVTVAAVAHTLSFYGTGTITLSGVSTAGPLVGTGVYPQRVSLTFTPTAGSLTLTVSGSCKFVQLEAGSNASSFIPTAGSAVVRNADVLTYPATGNISNTIGSCYAEISTFQSSGFGNTCIVSTRAGHVGPLVKIGGTSTDISIRENFGNSATKSSVTSFAFSPQKVASSYGANSLKVTGSGLSPTETTPANVDIGPIAAIAVGCATDGTLHIFCTIKNVRIYQTQLTSAQLSAVTA